MCSHVLTCAQWEGVHITLCNCNCMFANSVPLCKRQHKSLPAALPGVGARHPLSSARPPSACRLTLTPLRASHALRDLLLLACFPSVPIGFSYPPLPTPNSQLSPHTGKPPSSFAASLWVSPHAPPTAPPFLAEFLQTACICNLHLLTPTSTFSSYLMAFGLAPPPTPRELFPSLFSVCPLLSPNSRLLSFMPLRFLCTSTFLSVLSTTGGVTLRTPVSSSQGLPRLATWSRSHHCSPRLAELHMNSA